MTTPQTVIVKAGTPAGTWTIQLPLMESEQFDTTSDDQGKGIKATEICVYRRWRDLPAVFQLGGLEIHQNGSVGSCRLGRTTDLEEFSSRCPQTFVQVVKAGEKLVERIRHEADRAVEEIRDTFAVPTPNDVGCE
jgi:hypothetical protein